ncbi:MAG: TIGR03013 family PEP-CTERM/XrtA system glycosyltransferase [Alphaproteobacteria bacterium]|nr:TIGR03013 family PEP-CTERM/XrtA system glycosyltransferase [Alphaproteobacteria bacterium]MCB9929119.1 TIGR03013 family PEP-CTERM/XrtA system glycosyltransferase [Alphaproteobacteria bacterium]
MMLFGHHLRRMTVFLCLLEAAIFVAAFFAVARGLPLANFNPASVGEVFQVAVVPTVLLFLAMVALGTYNIDVLQSPGTVTQRLVAVAVLGGIATLVLAALGICDLISARQMVLAEAAAFPLILVGRLSVRYLTAVPVLRSRALVLGTGPSARRVWEALSGDNLGRLYRFVAIDAGASDHPEVPAARTMSRPESIADFALRNNIDQVVVALDNQPDAMPMADLVECRRRGIKVEDTSAFIERETGKVDLDGLGAGWLVFDKGFELGPLGQLLKRGLDVAVSGALLILFAPVLLATALLIKLDSPGPVFYRQTRVGLNGKPYSILKFRSMVQDAEKDGKAQWAKSGDARVTRVGAIIRKTRVDEIPQAINVLKGDMSFVGPRPERPVFVDQLAAEIPYYNERHRVKPGITGWAQISYPYGASVEDAREKLKYDLYYIKHQSFLFDLVIILQTVRIVLFAEGAR